MMKKSTHSDYHRSSPRSHHRDHRSYRSSHSRHHSHRYRSRSRSRDHRRHDYRDYSREREREREHRDRSRRYRHISKSPIKSSNRRPADQIDRPKIIDIPKPTGENAPISTTEKSKRDRELYVTNLPSGLSTKEIVNLLNIAMISIEANIKPGDPILNATTIPDKDYTLLEFRTPEECVNGYKLNGMSFLNKPIVLGKPLYSDEIEKNQERDMFPTLSSFEKDLLTKSSNNNINNIGASSSLGSYPIQTSAKSAIINNNNFPSTSKIFVSNIPLKFKENDVKEIFKIFGRIKSIELLTDPTTKEFNGQCNLEYETEKSTQEALHYAMGMKLSENVLYVKRSTSIIPTYNINTNNSNLPSSRQGLGILTTSVNSSTINSNNTISGISTEDYIKFRENNPSKVLCIKNMVSIQELDNKDEYDELYDDVLEECKSYGKVIQIKIPRPSGEYGSSGVGKVFVEYANRDGAKWAKDKLNGYVFRNRELEVVYHPEESFRKNQLD